MNQLIKYADRILEIKPYNCSIERDLILYCLKNEEEMNIDDILYILKDNFKINKNIEELLIEEKFLIAFLLAENSTTSEINVKFKCECQHPIDTYIDISNILIKSNFDERYKNIIKDTLSNNINDYFLIDYKDLDTSEYDEICQHIIENCTKFNFSRIIECLNCHEKIEINFMNYNALKSVLSEYDLANFYKSINRLVFSGKYDLNGIMTNLYPFERSVLINVLNEEIEEINKRRKAKKS